MLGMNKVIAVIMIGGQIMSAYGVERPCLPLYKKYPRINIVVPHIQLGTFPTPIQRLEKLGTLLGAPQLYIKKDNESGTLFGGNKVRKLEFLLGEATAASNVKGVATWGFACSNHTCATALYCHQLGLPCFCLHVAQTPTLYGRRNLLLSHACGAQLRHYRGKGEREAATYQLAKDFKRETGGQLYFIPSGGSNHVGTIGFVNAIFELKEQIDQGLMPSPDYIYAALGSAGTTAGLILGIKAAGLTGASGQETKVVPVCIEPDDYHNQHSKELCCLIKETSERLHKADRRFPLVNISPKDLAISFDFVGAGYAKISNEAHDAIRLLRETEGITLDGTYTGKTFAALVHDVATKDIKDKVILFWNTYCAENFTTITSTVDYKNLPQQYHYYFETPVQNNDDGI